MNIVFTHAYGHRFQFSRTAPQSPAQGLPEFRHVQDARQYLAQLSSPLPNAWQRLWRQWRPADSGLSDSAIQERLAQELVDKKLWLTPESTPAPKNSTPGAAPGKSESSKSRPVPEELVPVSPSSTAPPPGTVVPSDVNAVGTANPGQVSPESKTGAPPFANTATEGCPISMVSGEEVLPITDFVLPGPVPFVWQRFYRTGHRRNIGLGMGWTHNGGETLRLENGAALLADGEGRELRFALPRLYQRSKLLNEGLDLDYVSRDCFILRQAGQNDKVFLRRGPGTQFFLAQIRHPAYRPAQRTGSGMQESARGYCLDFHYDSSGRLARVQGNWGKALHFRRDSAGQIVSIALHNERDGESKIVAEYDYDAQSHLIAHRNAQGVGESYSYSHHLLSQRRLATGFSYYYEWDGTEANARCVHTWGDGGVYEYRFRWDPENNASCATNGLGHTTTYVYDEFGNIVHKIDPEGGIHRYAYVNGVLTAYTDPDGATTHYLYDEAQRLTGTRDALGQRRTVYYFQGQPTEYTDPSGARWVRAYNASGQIESITDPLGAVTRFRYAPDGLVKERIDPDNRRTQFHWNEQGELKSLVHAAGHRLEFHYNSFGQIIERHATAHDSNIGAVTRFDYTPSGRIGRVTAPDGSVTSYTYNEADQLIAHRDAYGRETRFEYDGLTQPVRRIDPAGQVLEYAYDLERNLVQLTNENGDHYRFAYDGNERLIEEIGFDGRVQQYRYSPAGHLRQHVDAGEVLTEFERDALGQLHTQVRRTLVGDSLATERTRYRYDAAGRLAETYNAHQYLTFAYDARGQIVRETHCDLNEKQQRVLASQAVITHRYDLLGQRVSTTLPDRRQIDYTYGPQRAFESVALDGQVIAQITRDSLGREVRRQQGALTTVTDYDPQGRLQRQYATHQDTKSRPIQREYGYAPNGLLASFTDGPEETRYVYDMLERLTHTEGAHPEHFAFDPAGNLLAISEGAVTTPGRVEGNRLKIQGDKHFDYDARGNLIREQRGKDGSLQRTFTYNLHNQLVAVTGTRRDDQVRFTYDPLGRRLAKTDIFGTTRFLWVDNLLTQETRGEIKKTYLYEPGTFRPLAQIQDGQVYHYHLDHLGTPRELTDAQGKIVWKARYRTYGNLALKEVDEVENNLRFQGQYHDPETGLHYNRFRYYNPETGQFVTQDPIGLLGGVNNYQYAPNPVMWVDPWGLCKEEGVFKVLEDNAGPILVSDIKKLYSSNPLNSVLDLHEFAALHAYTKKWYRPINSGLRGLNPDLLKEWTPVIESAKSGMDRMSMTSSLVHEGIVYRGMDITETEIHALFTEGGEFSDAGFMSSSLARSAAFDGQAQLTIKSKSGVKVADLSAHDDEKEVLFKPGTKFDVTKKTQDKDGTWHIDLEEKT